jgi:transposase
MIKLSQAKNKTKRKVAMLEFRLKLSRLQYQQIKQRMKLAQQLGKLAPMKRLLAIEALAAGESIATIATVLKVSTQAVRQWLAAFLSQGIKGLSANKSPGRPAKLSKEQKKQLAHMIEQGPNKNGFSGGCWRSPMIQLLIKENFGVCYTMQYISQLLRSMGFSYQKAKFECEHLNKAARKQWLEEKWPQIMQLAQQKQAYVLFGDEASFPQWGTLSYTWARRGHQPVTKTSGKRQAYKVFGLIDYFSGRFFYQCTQQRLNSATYIEFLQQVLRQTRKHIILIQDGARYHCSRATKAFFSLQHHRITVFDLPSYSPDFNPIEKLWKNIKKDHTHLCYFPSFDSLCDKVEQALWVVSHSPKAVLSLFGFYDYSVDFSIGHFIAA